MKKIEVLNKSGILINNERTPVRNVSETRSKTRSTATEEIAIGAITLQVLLIE